MSAEDRSRLQPMDDEEYRVFCECYDTSPEFREQVDRQVYSWRESKGKSKYPSKPKTVREKTVVMNGKTGLNDADRKFITEELEKSAAGIKSHVVDHIVENSDVTRRRLNGVQDSIKDELHNRSKSEHTWLDKKLGENARTVMGSVELWTWRSLKVTLVGFAVLVLAVAGMLLI